MIQARLRHGTTQWDMPERFYDTKGMNDQSALLWRDDSPPLSPAGGGGAAAHGGGVWFFGGGRNQGSVDFQLAHSNNSGASWTGGLALPDVPPPPAPQPGKDLTPQPITNAFRAATTSTTSSATTTTNGSSSISGGGSLFFGMDAGGAESALWRSDDDGITWHDTGGRTAGRHTTFFPANASSGDASSSSSASAAIHGLGGKLSNIQGFMPAVTSLDGGVTYGKAYRLPFPALGSNQRPCVYR